MSYVKIVATIGPKTRSAESLLALAEAGMNIARLNGSHADLSWHAETIRLIRRTIPHIPILLDIPGRKIRTALLEHEPVFSKGEAIILTTEDGHDGRHKISVNSSNLHELIDSGSTLLADDGTLRFTVLEIRDRDIICRAEISGQLKSRKGINVPSVSLKGVGVTARDNQMLSFAKEYGVDFIGISFVESAAQIEEIRKLIDQKTPRIISKVENQGAMENLEEVIQASEAIMIDRGDLSAETTLEHMALFQKRILALASKAGKPVIVATEMLHSMIVNPVPTKAEISDISNSTLDGASALMLSGETAVGQFPVEAVRMMRRIADTVSISSQENRDQKTGSETIPEAMAEAISLICRQLPITKIVAITSTGYAARMLSSYQPKQPILAVTNDLGTARSMNLLYGTQGVLVNVPFSRTSTDHILVCLKELWSLGHLDKEDFVLVTSVAYPKPGNRMNAIQTHRIIDLCNSQSWTCNTIK